jgi:N-methylhydantoinase B
VRLDALSLAVIKGSLEEVVEEMDRVLERAAFSPVISQGRDRASGIYKGSDGSLVVQGESGLPIFIGAMQFTTQAVLAAIGRENMHEGDIYIVNDPYSGGTHLLDVKLLKPVFWEDRLYCFLCNTGHWLDVGGSVPGGFPVSATEIYQEGLRIPPVKLCDRGRLNDALHAVIFSNTRVPEECRGDLMAQINALEVGDERLRQALQRFGRPAVDACIEELEERSAAQMRDCIRALPPGRYSSLEHMDNDGITDRPLDIALDMTVGDGSIVFDLSRSGPPCQGPMNLARETTISALLVAIKHCFPDVPVNAGCLRPLSFIVPDSIFLGARLPSPTAGFAEVTQRVMDSVFAALGQAIPDALFAAPMATANNLTLSGYRSDGSRFVAYLFHGGGYGGNPQSDGLIHGSPTLSISRIQPLEIIERRYPLLFHSYAIRPDSGGAGEHRGGCGTEYELEVLADSVQVALCGDRARFGPFGLQGGEPGACNEITFFRDGAWWAPDLGAKVDRLTLPKGSRIRLRSPGGGGFGDPHRRDPASIATDLKRGYVSAARAQQAYGIVLNGDGTVSRVPQ